MRARAGLLLAILAVPMLLSGCLGGSDGARLMAPTDAPLRPPTPTPRTAPPVNYSDPGYIMEGEWRAGDGWDYHSNLSKYRYVRVLEVNATGATPRYLIEERYGAVGSPPSAVSRAWVDGGNWTRVEHIDQTTGSRQAFDPGQPLRYFKNGTFRYNYSLGGETFAVAATSRYVGESVLLFPWGYVQAGKVEHRIVTADPAGKHSRTMVTRWVHQDYLNEVQYQIDDTERFVLVAAKVGDLRRGTLR